MQAEVKGSEGGEEEPEEESSRVQVGKAAAFWVE